MGLGNPCSGGYILLMGQTLLGCWGGCEFCNLKSPLVRSNMVVLCSIQGRMGSLWDKVEESIAPLLPVGVQFKEKKCRIAQLFWTVRHYLLRVLTITMVGRVDSFPGVALLIILTSFVARTSSPKYKIRQEDDSMLSWLPTYYLWIHVIIVFYLSS